MSVAARLVAFAAVLALSFAGAALAGAAIDPTDEEVAAAGPHRSPQRVAGADGHRAQEHDAPPATVAPAEAGERGAHRANGVSASGLAVSQDGLGIEVERTFLTAGEATPLRFRITDEHGRAVRDELELEHDRELHLIVVRRDTAVFEHLHPRKARDGTWSTEVTLPEAGVYRMYADFKIDGEQRTLAADLFVPGDFRPERLPAPEAVDRAGELAVGLSAPGVRAGRATELTFSVTRDGKPFEALEPYLGAKGHLVALREGDLAYLHVHPTEGGDAHAHGDGSRSRGAHASETRFATTFPTAGRYRLFLQLKTGGQVRTVAYTVEVRR